MKTSTLVSMIAAASLCAAPLAPAAAQPYRAAPHRHHHHHAHPVHPSANAFVGATLLIGGLALALNTARPQPVVVSTPPVVITSVPVSPPAMWYWCDAYGAYYPYVATCPGPWRRVPAR